MSALIVYEAGKPWPEADADTAETIDFLEFYGREMLRFAGPQKVTPMKGEKNYLVYIPLGVGVVIPPWNFPAAIMAGMAMASLATGNTVVLKPAGDTMTVAAKFVEIAYEAGIPKDALHRIHRFERSRPAHQRISRQNRAGPEVDQAHCSRDGRQRFHHRG